MSEPKTPRPRAPQIPGITYRVLDYWVHRGYVRPTLEFPKRPAGRGNRRVWPADEERIARDIAQLRQHGIALPKAAELARRSPAAVQEALRAVGGAKGKGGRR